MMDSEMQDSALKALQKYCEDKGISDLPRILCQWCNGRGCIACAAKRKKIQDELDAAYKAQFPDGPKPIFTANLQDPKQVEQLKSIFHADKLKDTFGPDGGGIEEIQRKCQEAMAGRT